VPVRADRGVGLDALKAALDGAASRPVPDRASPFPEPFRREVERLGAALAGAPGGGPLPRYLVGRLLLGTGGYFDGHPLAGCDPRSRDELAAARARLAREGCPVPAVEAVARYGWVGRVVEGVVTHPDAHQATLGDRIDHVLTHRFWGTLVLAA